MQGEVWHIAAKDNKSGRTLNALLQDSFKRQDI